MFNKIQRIRLEELFNLFEQDNSRLDVILCRDGDLLIEIQTLLEDERLVTLVTLEPEDLHDQRSILVGLYQVFFDEEPLENDEALEIIEAVEDELGELQSCLLIVEDFSNCSIQTQAALLELAIVSRSFKLVLKIEEDFYFSGNEQLWNVLAPRSSFLESNDGYLQNNDELIASYDGRDEDHDEENDNEWQEQDDEELEDFQLETKSERKNTTNKAAWHQLIPKYHIAAGIFLVILVFSLWNMDVNQKKEQSVDLQLHENDQFEKIDNATLKIEEKELVENNESLAQERVALTENIQNDSFIHNAEKDDVPVKESVKNDEVKISENPLNKEQASSNQAAEIKKSNNIIKPIVEPNPVTEPKEKITKKIDWSPYQSDAWIRGLNGKYFTLQLMASHDDQGIRDFLKERGVSSQYAVYSTEKNGKPWHVIIYGVYESRDFADLARKELPAYLKDYSPWVRNLGEVKNSIK